MAPRTSARRSCRRPALRNPPLPRIPAPTISTAPPARPGASTAPSTSAPTTAGCCSLDPRGAASASSMPSRASSGSAKASRPDGAPVGGGHGAHARGAEGVCRQARPRTRCAGRAWSPPRPAASPRTATSSSSACATRLGLDIEILSREIEARLAVSGCASLIDAQLRLRAGVRHRRRLLRADPARPDAPPAQVAALPLSERIEVQNCIGRLDVAADRRRHAGRALRRPPRRPPTFDGHGRRCHGACSSPSRASIACRGASAAARRTCSAPPAP